MSATSIRRALVVEDEEVVGTFLSRLLKRKGYAVFLARDGFEGLLQLEKANPDIVFLDLVIPGIGGLDLLRLIREKDPTIHVVITTGHSSEETAVTAAQMGVSDYLLKPFGIDRVYSVLDRLEKIIALRDAGREDDSANITLDNVEARLHNNMADAQRSLDRLFGLMGIADGDLMVGMLEMVFNAIEHGNLELGHESKTKLTDTRAYLQCLRERAEVSPYKERMVKLAMHKTGTDIEGSIEDEGPGFDWKAMIDRPSEPDMMLHHGRGLRIAGALFDLLEYNETGNRVRLVKKNVKFREGLH